ncbi:hypothetical protein G7054_g10136 [Neopestalotiopsis clavispora]|nr:hypothetical protein G7054_g10136 [Neopestalotiopsis clavispora]
MQSPSSSRERPYRSHLRPACHPCRRRKSRCKHEAQSSSCLMCRVHGTDCVFPGSQSLQAPLPKKSRPEEAGIFPQVDSNQWGNKSHETDCQPTPLSVDDAEQDNSHIVGPANTSDIQVLADYLSVFSSSNGGVRMVRPFPSSHSKPVMFANVKKRPLGMDNSSNPSREKLKIIEKLLEPNIDQLIDLYFRKVNVCVPLLDRCSFKHQNETAKDKISPALLASLYAHTLTYWRFAPERCEQRVPDGRFIWNLANEALYSELHLSPGISTITAILLNIGGRPTTSLIGNGVQLGAAVSLAYSLGLNRDPLPWDIPNAEKLLRMKIWWSLMIHDKWSSLAHGTPFHIQDEQYDVPFPTKHLFKSQGTQPFDDQAEDVFIALFGLTRVLSHCLQHLYCIIRDNDQISNLDFKLNYWVEKLETNVRRIITRGNFLELPGAANLRLSYISVQLLIKRLELEHVREIYGPDSDMLANQYMQVRRTAEEIVLFVQELGNEQLSDFWLPMSAFMFSSTTTFLLRCALETETSQAELATSTSLRLAWDLITSLRNHREQYGWDLGDICLDQHEEIIERLIAPSATQAIEDVSLSALTEMALPEVPFLDQLFPNMWDTF